MNLSHLGACENWTMCYLKKGKGFLGPMHYFISPVSSPMCPINGQIYETYAKKVSQGLFS